MGSYFFLMMSWLTPQELQVRPSEMDSPATVRCEADGFGTLSHGRLSKIQSARRYNAKGKVLARNLTTSRGCSLKCVRRCF